MGTRHARPQPEHLPSKLRQIRKFFGYTLEEMAQSTGIDDFSSLVRGILYAERTGVPIARTIAAHAAQMRVKRRLKIRTEAARASLKILIPTVGCVFPTLWLILLGPALIVVMTIASK